MEPEQQVKLRQIIHDHLTSSNVYDKIRAFVRDFLETEQGVTPDDDKLLCVLREKGIIEDMLDSLGSNETVVPSQCIRRTAPESGARYLHVRLSRGSAFIDNCFVDLDEKDRGMLYFHVLLFGQRFSSKPVPACIEPDLDEAFLFEIPHHIESSALFKVITSCRRVSLLLYLSFIFHGRHRAF